MGPKILIVDDDADLRRSLSDILESAFETLEASNGAEALETIKRNRPRLVLLDVSMPGMDGLETLAAALALAPATLVVMLTSHRDIDLAREALRLGAVEFVTKPFDAEYIRAEVSRLLDPAHVRANDKPWRIGP